MKDGLRSAEERREKAQNAQESKSHFATFALFGGHSVGANSLGLLVSERSNQSKSVKVGQTDAAGQPAGANRMQIFNNERLANNQASGPVKLSQSESN
jgi:hypothetical protein